MIKYFKPRFYRDAILLRLARALRQPLARTPLVWGDSSRLKIGKRVHLVDAILNVRSGDVIIEDDVFLGHGVMLLTGKHDIRTTGVARQLSVQESGRDIIIHSGAWIASGVIVIGPCEVGANSVIGAGSVVTGTIPPNTLYSKPPSTLSSPIRYTE